jgi:dienelactone hydrolase
VVGALAIIWWRGVPFPQTTGPFNVGRASFHLVDSSRKEIFTENPDDVRELMVTVHYPAEVPDGVHFSAYADPRLAAALAEAYGVPRFLSGLMHCHSVDGAPAAKKEGGFPVVIFSPGGDSNPLFYSAMLEELASQGFIVASVCHTYTTGVTVFPDGRAVRANDAGCGFETLARRHEASPQTKAKAREAIGAVWLADVRFVLDSLAQLNRSDERLAGRLDLSHVGIFGHSFGGATAAAAVQSDRRFTAGINLDGGDLSHTRGEAIRDKFVWLCSEPPAFAGPPSLAIGASREPAKIDVAVGPKDQQRVAIEKGATPPGARVIQRRACDPADVAAPPSDSAGHPHYSDGIHAPPGCRITLAGSRHPVFESDVALLSATFPWSCLVGGENVGTLNGRRAVAVVNSFVMGFFRQRLQNQNVPWLDDPSSEFPELSRDVVTH